MRAETMSMMVMRLFTAMALNSDFDGSVCDRIRVPSFAGLREV